MYFALCFESEPPADELPFSREVKASLRSWSRVDTTFHGLCLVPSPQKMFAASGVGL